MSIQKKILSYPSTFIMMNLAEKMEAKTPFLLTIMVCLMSLRHTDGHGRLLDPPSRSSMWRMGFRTPKNYNDNELFCGGLTRQRRNGMRCGICGDPYDARAPRANEMGGRYYSGIISHRYNSGEVIKATVELTANHNGFFEFHICNVNGNASLETEECLQKNPLEVIGEGRAGRGNPYRYYVPRPSTGKYEAALKLPKHFVCDHCVFQWTYTAGNNWGTCEDGRQAVGCGPQETFRGCADIAIVGEAVVQQPPLHTASSKPIAAPPLHAASSKPIAAPPRHSLPVPPLRDPWAHWQSVNAWPQSVNPGYPVESNRTTWFYHQWPATAYVPATTTMKVPSEPYDLKTPFSHRYSTSDTRRYTATAAPSYTANKHEGILNHSDYAGDLKKPPRATNHQRIIRKFETPSSKPALPDESLKKLHGYEGYATSSRPPPVSSYIHRTLPPVVLIENVQNEVLTDTFDANE
ncbi:uncharacterized protein LOC100907903 [Galendromus occidentalis]|uniref:Uncharacterized protein LOC100907903 n=1 Tax=Galendromus occidentalis TaxID=34638 RepID=A0AAJ7PAL4_9ACAR|nr:uncharacterized protein LOC100907903 [Galendromus occidentalis]